MTSLRSVTTSAKRAWLPVRYARWGPVRATEPGYTLVVPVPGDLPVFARIALAVCRLQDRTHRVETLVVPDIDSPAVERVVSDAAADWPGPLRTQHLPALERLLLPRLGDPGKNHGAQIIAAVTASRATHVLLHDADLFMLAADVHDSEYEFASAHHAAVVGVDGPWDPWFAQHDRALVATWEMCADVTWLRSFRPSLHFGHDGRMFGERHTFDTTFWAQALTDQTRLLVVPRPDDVVHFNYVISTYRRFQRHTGSRFVDSNLRILLIRLFVDLFDRDGPGYAVPSREELVRGLTSTTTAVGYEGVDPVVYREFRTKVSGILTGSWVEPSLRSHAVGYLDPFDEHFGLSDT